MPDPTLTNSASGDETTSSPTCSFGFTATAGRLLVLVVGADDYDAGNPSGWTMSTGCAQETYLGHYLWWKIAAGTETNVQYTLNGAAKSAWAVCEFDNIEGTSSLDVSNGQQATSSDNSYTTPAVVPSSGRRFAVATIGGSGDIDFTGLSGWTNSYTERADNATTGTGTRQIIGVATLALDGNGSSSTSTGATYSHFADSRTGIIAVFKVAAGGSSIAPLASRYFSMMRSA